MSMPTIEKAILERFRKLSDEEKIIFLCRLEEYQAEQGAASSGHQKAAARLSK